MPILSCETQVQRDEQNEDVGKQLLDVRNSRTSSNMNVESKGILNLFSSTYLASTWAFSPLSGALNMIYFLGTPPMATGRVAFLAHCQMPLN